MLKRLLLSIVVSAALIALFLHFIPVDDLRGQLSGMRFDWVWLPLFLLAVAGNIYLRGETLALLVNDPGKVSASRWMAISSAHNMSTSLSGMVLGDAILTWLMNRFHISWKRSLFTTFIARLFELSPLILILFLGLLLAGEVLPAQGLWALLVGLGFALSVCALFALDALLARVPASLLFGQVEKVALIRSAYRELAGRCMRPLLLLSFAKIALSLLYFVFALNFFSVDLNLWQVCLVFGIFNFATVFPVQGLAGLGTFEAYFGAGLVLLGMPGATALSLALLVHLLFLGSFALVTVLAFLPLLLAAGGRSR